jgi:antitoxin PrlF
MNSAITSKGRVTIPKEIREHLGLKAGDRVKFFLHPNGSVVLLPVRPIRVLRGMLKSRRRRAVSIEEMNEGIAEGASGVERAGFESGE